MEKLLIAKEEKKITYMELEKMTGVNYTTLFRYFNGKIKKIPYDVVVKLEKVLLEN